MDGFFVKSGRRRLAVAALIGSLTGVAPKAGLAQVSSAPNELGLAGAYTGLARGYESILVNPANLGLPGASAWSVGLPQVAVGGSIVGPGFGDLLDLVRYDEQSADRRSELLSTIPGEGTEGGFSVRAPVAAVSIGGFGFAVTYSASGRHSFSRDVVELFVEGYEEGRTDYSAGNTRGASASYWDIAAGYGRGFGDLSIGAAAHYIRGGTIGQTRLFEPRIDLVADEVEVDYVGVRARDGSGLALDVGAAYRATPEVTLSGSIANAVSSLHWSDDPYYRMITVDRATIDESGPMDLRDQYVGSDRPMSAGPVPAEVAETAEGLMDDAGLPRVVRLGVAWRVRTGTTIAADVHRRLSDGRLADVWKHRMSLGLEQTFSLLAVRAGYAVGSDGAGMFGAGLSVGPLDLAVARYGAEAGPDASREGWFATIGLGVGR